MPNTDQVISVTSEKVLTISRPSKRNNFRSLGRGGRKNKVRSELVNKRSLLEIEDLDRAGSGSTKPVSVRREGQRVDLITGSKGVKVLEAVKIPKDDVTVLATGSAKRSIRRDSNGGNVSGVSNVVGNELGVLDIPNLKITNVSINKISRKICNNV